MTRTCLIALAFSLIACEDTVTTADVEGSCPATCDDGDMCTDNRCDADTGACVHVPRDVQNACRQDNHCDDGDPCTTDTCVFDVAGGCPELQRCQHDQLPSCRSCPSFPTQCDDGSVCTTDVCGADLICRYTTEEYCNPRCVFWNYTWPGQTFVGPATVRGTPWPRDGASCQSGCACTKEMALSDGNGNQLRLAGIEPAATCDVTSCQQQFSCQPMAVNRYYLLYGEASNPTTPQQIPARADAGSNGAACAPPPEDIGQPPEFASQLDVEGYCLFLDAQGLDGQYDATLVLDAEAQAIAYKVTFSGLQPSFTGSARVAATFDFGFPGVDDGASLRLDFYLDNRHVTARLFPGTDRLVGPLFDPDQIDQPAGDSAGDKAPQDPGEPGVPQVPVPPQPRDGKRIGTLTLILR